jgi:hypothetical protein
MARYLGGALVLALMVTCRGDVDQQPPEPARVVQAAASDTRVDAVAAADAVVDATTDAAVDAWSPIAVVPGREVPEFTCLGWSRRRGLAACIIGSRGHNVGDSDVALVFEPLRPNTEVPEPLTLIHRSEEEGPGPEELPQEQVAELVAQLRGFVTIDRAAPVVELVSADSHVGVTPPISAGGATLSLQATSHGTVVYAPKLRVVLTIQLAGHARTVLEEAEGAISAYTARLIVLDHTVIVERRYGIGDEGTSAAIGDVWVCNAGHCDPGPVQPAVAP